jgi:iron complex transport system substrate-binding protein
MNRLLPVCLLAALAVGCTSKREKAEEAKSAYTQTFTSENQIVLQYAKGFDVKYGDGYILVNLQDPQHEESNSFRYALVKRGTHPEGIPSGYTMVEIPVRSVICMTSLQLSNFIKLGMQEKVVGITSTRHLFNPVMNRQLENGQTVKIGIEGNFDNEVIMAVNPDLILISPFKRGGYEALKNVGIPLIPHLGYKELTPLGQAEWIKFISLLLGVEEKANRQFVAMEKKYNDLKSLTESRQGLKRPVVFSGEFRGGNWYAVGGESFLARLFKDAGADYFMKGDARSGGVTLDFETVYNQADEADYWRMANSYPGTFSYQALKEQDLRYADFRAFREKRIIYCNMREKPFYESMPVEPEVMLADLLHIFHPELLPAHTPVYYDLLK